jgi:uncharacterized protein YbjT (DUF2867 family)
MKLTVFGATGATGRQVVARALALGHEVVAVVRRPETVPSAARLTVRKGDVLDASSLVGTVDGADAVISCIGPTKNLSPGTVMSQGVPNIIAACQRAEVRRLVLQSGITLSSGEELSVTDRWAVRVLRRVFAKAGDDKAIAERALQASGLEWVLVRAVGLREGPATGRYTAGPKARVAPLLPLSFSDCADCLLRAANEPAWVGRIINVGR